jgi:flagellar motor switch protein FliM
VSDLLETAAPARAGASSEDDRRSAVLRADSSRIRAFDLLRQESIERARLRRLQPVLETVAHRIASSMTSVIRQPTLIEVTSLEQKPWEEHSNALPDPSFVSSAVLLPLEGRVVFHLPVNLMLTLFDFYLGGDGSQQPERDSLTEIERSLVGPIVDTFWNEVPPPFGTLLTLNVAMIQNSTSAQLLQVGRPGIICLIVEMSMMVGDRPPEKFSLALPLTVLLPVIEQIERAQSSEGIPGIIDKKEARRRILEVPVDVKVCYPTIELTPSELLGLRVGDVIPLNQEQGTSPNELLLMIQDTFVGTGVLVENGNKVACTVVTKKEMRHE